MINKWVVTTPFGAYAILARDIAAARTLASALGLVGTIVLANDSQPARCAVPRKTCANGWRLALAA